MSNAVARKLESIREKGAMKNVDVTNILGSRPETVSRWNQGRAYPHPDAEKTLLELEYIIDQLSDFYAPDEARLWLFSRQKLLDGEIPASASPSTSPPDSRPRPASGLAAIKNASYCARKISII